MDTIQRRDLTGVELWLPIREAVAFLVDPKVAQAEVRRALRTGGIDAETGKRQAPRPTTMQAKLAGRIGDGDDFSQYDQRPAGTVARRDIACPEPGCRRILRGPAALALHAQMHERERKRTRPRRYKAAKSGGRGGPLGGSPADGPQDPDYWIRHRLSG